MNYRLILFKIILIACVLFFFGFKKKPSTTIKPNILWITIEDWSPDLSCYGTKGIYTPHIDALASQGIRYENAFSTSPVCSTSRSAMMTGFHQNYIGANQHRENNKSPLPKGVKPIPKYFEEAGYYTTLMSWKTDINFTPNKKNELFMDTTNWFKEKKAGWSNRKKGQPFFARITFQDTHRKWNRDSIRPINTKDIDLPPYYADTEFIRRDWANGLEQMQIVDRQIGKLLSQLDADGLADNTIVFFIADHGRCHIRGKQFLYDGGIRIPMIMRWPNRVNPNQVSNNLVYSIDICATILDAAGITPDIPLHGKNLLSKEIENRNFIYVARDKMDNTHDAMRAVRSKRFKLILNLMPERPWLQYNNYKEGAYPALAEMSFLHMKGLLTQKQSAFFASNKPKIELFDLEKDPFELNNVADDPIYKPIKEKLLSHLESWRTKVINDKGVTLEFRAKNKFPKHCPTPTVDEWVYKNKENYNFKKTGWPAWYPTRTLKDWEIAKKKWEPFVFRPPNKKQLRPDITIPKKKK